MWTALLSKELRECGLVAGLALLVQIHLLSEGMGLPLVSVMSYGRQNEIPFLGSGRDTSFLIVAIVLAAVLGLQQTVWESWRQTTLLLLHRPWPRSRIFLGKLAAGGLLLLAVCAVPLLVYSLWAATPGTHASPFAWSMTEPWWRAVVAAGVCYLGAFLTGLRPARWLGSRTWPLLTAVLLACLLLYGVTWWPLAYAGLVALAGWYVASILETARLREYP